jgi:hypothetical protein
MNLKKIIIILTALFSLSLTVFTMTAYSIGIKDTKHNLSVYGRSDRTIYSLNETGVCIFCHTPHNANPAYPLWGHVVTGQIYTHYTSPTLQSYSSEADAPPIDGVSRLCLSCHDGTIAVGALTNTTVETTKEFIMPEDIGFLSTDLSGGHPISIVYDESLVNRRNNMQNLTLKLNSPSEVLMDRDVHLYPTQGGFGVQCSSCHDPHGGQGGSEAPPFWRKTTTDGVCLVCHNPAVDDEDLESIDHDDVP